MNRLFTSIVKPLNKDYRIKSNTFLDHCYARLYDSKLFVAMVFIGDHRSVCKPAFEFADKLRGYVHQKSAKYYLSINELHFSEATILPYTSPISFSTARAARGYPKPRCRLWISYLSWIWRWKSFTHPPKQITENFSRYLGPTRWSRRTRGNGQ